MPIRTIPWDRQPQVPAAPVRHGPYAGPALLWNAATPHVNLANGAMATGAGTGVSQRPGPFGKEADFSGSGTGQYIFVTGSEQDQVTLALQARVDSVADLDRLLSGYSGASSGRFDIYYESAASAWTLAAFRATTNAIIRLTGLPVTFSGSLVVRYILGQTPDVFYNGAPLAATVTNAGSGALVASSNRIGVGGRPDVTTRQLDGGIALAYRLDRALSESEARALSMPGAMPALLFEPRRIWVPMSAGGGGSFQAAWARNRNSVIGAGAPR